MTTKTSPTALLVMDAQSVIVEPAPPSFFVAMRRALDAAHDVGLHVIYVRVELRPGHAGVSPRNSASLGSSQYGRQVVTNRPSRYGDRA